MPANHDAKPRQATASDAARRQRRIGWTMSGILAAIYLSFLVSIIAWPEAMSTNIGGNLTPGLALGACGIFLMLGLGCYYVAQANRNDIEQARRP